MLRFLKNWTLPVAIVVGVGLYFIFALTPQLDAAGERLEPIIERLLPTTIFLTLFVTFSKVDFHNMRLRRWHYWLFLAQFLLIGIIDQLCEVCIDLGKDRFRRYEHIGHVSSYTFNDVFL